MGEPVLIGIDWGTTNARAYLLDATGAIVARSDPRAGAALGIMHVADGEFFSAFDRLCATIPGGARPDLPVVLSGMITSRQGWIETPYVACPAHFDDVAAAAVRRKINGWELVFAPGLSDRDADGAYEVMRGEELQILGALADPGDTRDVGVYCLPGTHSKWAWVADGRIQTFRTVMTGEVYGVLCDHSILGRLMEARDDDADAFAQGAARARAGGYVLHDIFTTRTEGLFDRLAPDAMASYLSGLLIGHEVAAMAGMLDQGAAIGVIGGADLAARYASVLDAAGFAVIRRDDPVVTRGQLGLARAIGMVETP